MARWLTTNGMRSRRVNGMRSRRVHVTQRFTRPIRNKAAKHSIGSLGTVQRYRDYLIKHQVTKRLYTQKNGICTVTVCLRGSKKKGKGAGLQSCYPVAKRHLPDFTRAQNGFASIRRLCPREELFFKGSISQSYAQTCGSLQT